MTSHAPVVLDIAGTTLSADDRRRLKHPLTGGLILFSRHWVDRRQLTELTSAIKRVRPDLLICVDHEGGRVQRFRTDGFTHLPPMRRLGELWMKDALAATDAATACGYVLARNCAPVVWTSASRRCSTSTSAPAASSATVRSTVTRAWPRCWPRA